MADDKLLKDLDEITELSRAVRTCADLSTGSGATGTGATSTGRLTVKAAAKRTRIRNNLINILDVAALHLVRGASDEAGLGRDGNVAAIVERDLEIVRYGAEAGETEAVRRLAARCLEIAAAILEARKRHVA